MGDDGETPTQAAVGDTAPSAEVEAEAKALARQRQLAGLRPFPPGVSGNISGGSQLTRELKLYIAGKTKEDIDAIRHLAEKASSEKVKLQARIWLAEQVIGKASQPLTDADGNPLRVLSVIVMPAEKEEP